MESVSSQSVRDARKNVRVAQEQYNAVKLVGTLAEKQVARAKLDLAKRALFQAVYDEVKADGVSKEDVSKGKPK